MEADEPPSQRGVRIGVARRRQVLRSWGALLPIALTLAATACAGGPSARPPPAGSPPGSGPVATQGKIAFESERDGSNSEIYVMNADGTGAERLTDDPADDFSPAWSPDGTQIAFATDRDGNYEVYVMNADGTGVENLTDDPSTDGFPAWSPDGAKIAFASDRDGNSEIYVMNADGTGAERLTDDPADDVDPAWSSASEAS